MVGFKCNCVLSSTHRIVLSVIHKPEHGLRRIFVTVSRTVSVFIVVRSYKINCFTFPLISFDNESDFK